MKQLFMKTTLLSLGTAVVLGLAGCSSSGGSDGTVTSVTSDGTAIDGILVGSTVCIDVNKNNACDAGEDSTITDERGKFTLESTQTGPLVLVGGTDIGTGAPFTGALKAPAGSSVVSPLTSAVQALVESGKSAEDAEASVKQAMGLTDVNVTLTDFDPFEKIADANATVAAEAQKILAQQTKLQVMVHAAAVTVAGSGEKTAASTMSQVFAAVAEKFDGATTGVELDAAKVQAITKSAADKVYSGDDDASVAARIAAKVSAEDVADSVAEDAKSAEATVTAASAGDALTKLNEAITKVNTSTESEVKALAEAALAKAAALDAAQRAEIERLQQEQEAQAAALEEAQAAKLAAEAALAAAEAQAQADLEAYKAYLAAKAEAEAAAKAEAEAQQAAAEAEAAAAAEAQAISDAQAAKEAEALALAAQAAAEAEAAALREAAALEAQLAAEAAADLAAAEAAAAAAEAAAEAAINQALVKADSTIVSFYVSQASNDANQTNVLAGKIATFMGDNNLTASAAAIALQDQADGNATAANATLAEMVSLQAQVLAMVENNETNITLSAQYKTQTEAKVGLVHANYIANLNLKSSVEFILAAEQAAAAAAAEAERVLAVIAANKTEVNAITEALVTAEPALTTAKDDAVDAATQAQVIADSNANAQTYADAAKTAADAAKAAHVTLLTALADAEAANVVVNNPDVTEQAAIDANVSANTAKTAFEAQAAIIETQAQAAATALAAAQAAPVDGGETPALAFVEGMSISSFDVWDDNGVPHIELWNGQLNGGTFIETSYELNTTTGIFEASTNSNGDYVLGASGWTTDSFKTYTLSSGVITFENGMAVEMAAEYDLANPTADMADLMAAINASVPAEDNVTFNAGAKAYILGFKPTKDMYELWYVPHVQLQDPTTYNWYETDQTFSALYPYMQSVNSPTGVYHEDIQNWIGVDFERNTASTQCDLYHNCPVIDSTGTAITSVTAGMTGNLVVTDHSAGNPYPQTKVGTWEAKTVTNGGTVIMFKPDAGQESYFEDNGDGDNLIAVADSVVRLGKYTPASTTFQLDYEQPQFSDVAVADIKAAIQTFVDNGGDLTGGTTPTEPTMDLLTIFSSGMTFYAVHTSTTEIYNFSMTSEVNGSEATLTITEPDGNISQEVVSVSGNVMTFTDGSYSELVDQTTDYAVVYDYLAGGAFDGETRVYTDQALAQAYYASVTSTTPVDQNVTYTSPAIGSWYATDPGTGAIEFNFVMASDSQYMYVQTTVGDGGVAGGVELGQFTLNGNVLSDFTPDVNTNAGDTAVGGTITYDSVNDTMTYSDGVNTVEMTRNADVNQPWLGAWISEVPDSDYMVGLVMYGDGTYLEVEVDFNNTTMYTETGGTGVYNAFEMGTYTVNTADLANNNIGLTATVVTDYNGEFGPPSGVEMTFDVTNYPTITSPDINFTRVQLP